MPVAGNPLPGALLPQPANATYLSAYSGDMTNSSIVLNLLSETLACQPTDTVRAELRAPSASPPPALLPRTPAIRPSPS